MAHHASYLSCIFNRKSQDNAMRWIKSVIKLYDLKFDGFIVTGVSGITMGSVAARTLRKDLVVCRKRNDDKHSYYYVENYKPNKRYVFLDDLIATGDTYERVCNQMEEIHKQLVELKWIPKDSKKSEVIGQMLYDTERYHSL